MLLIDPDSRSLLEEAVRSAGSSGKSRRPAITLAWAQSMDGSIARRRGERTTLSGSESLVCTHLLRSLHDAVLVGIGTVLADRPRLTVRNVSGPSPAVVVLDGNARIPADAPLFDSGVPVYILHRSTVVPNRRFPPQTTLMPIEENGNGMLSLEKAMRELKRRGVDSIMVEGGAQTLTSFLDLHLVDLAVITIAPVLLGGYNIVSRPFIESAKGVNIHIDRSFFAGEDMVVVARP